MKKKKYQKPCMEVVEMLHQTHLLQESEWGGELA